MEASRWCPHDPTEQQAKFLALECREALYGGAAGGGKSDALLMGALQYVDYPNFNAVLFRRTRADLQLPEALLDRAHGWLKNTAAKWDGRTWAWRFPSGAAITFAYLEHEADKYAYQGSAYQYIAFDELTQFLPTQYTYLFSRLRKTVSQPFPLRMRAGSNPGGIGHDWVFQRFFVEGALKAREFVPARVYDNPHLDIESYVENLGELDGVTKAQLLDGNWNARHSGSMFSRNWIEVVESPPPADSVIKIARYWDLTAFSKPATVGAKKSKNDYTVGTLGSRDKGGFVDILDVRRMKGTPKEIEDLVLETAASDGKDIPIGLEQEPGGSGVFTADYFIRQVLVGYMAKAFKQSTDKSTRARPFSTRMQNRYVRMMRAPWNGDWLNELEGFPLGEHDDQVDSASGLFEMLRTNNWWQDAAGYEFLLQRMAAEQEVNPGLAAQMILAQQEAQHASQVQRPRPGRRQVFFSVPGR